MLIAELCKIMLNMSSVNRAARYALISTEARDSELSNCDISKVSNNVTKKSATEILITQ